MRQEDESTLQDRAPAKGAMSKMGLSWSWTPPLTFERPNLKKRDWKMLIVLSVIMILLPFIVFLLTFSEARHNSKPIVSNTEPIVREKAVCDTVHLATVCGGYRATKDFHVLLKSILFHRRASKIHYHLFVDAISFRILTKLLETWPVPDLEVSFYNVTDYEHDISWITNSHYSNRYGLLKLMVPSILATKNVSQVILLDTDMVVLGDINKIWGNFSGLFKNSFLGLVENQSDWYLSRKDTSSPYVRPNVWPAIGRGFNTGLMLIDIEKAMAGYWNQLWREVAATELVEHLFTSLADQDIYNAVIKRHSWIVTKLPCNLNLQINNHTDIDETCRDYRNEEVNVVHWNSPYKLKTANKGVKNFGEWYFTFQDWNGQLLQRGVCPSKVPRRRIIDNPLRNFEYRTNPCEEFHPHPEEPLRTFLYAAEFELEDHDDDSMDAITAVVHLTVDRLQSLENLAARWTGPISASIYLYDGETSSLLSSIEGSEILTKRKNIGYHLVFKVVGWHYPINRMRNIALDNALTPYVFLTDIDFVPPKMLCAYLRATIRSMNRNMSKKALVIPAFESNQYRLEFPEDKKALHGEIDVGNIASFRHREWPKGQMQTDYSKWKSATQSYSVKWEEDYEPYIVTTKDVRRFDERFIGFGWNKVAHSMMLAADNYEFIVLPEAFIIHQDHAPSLDLISFRRDKNFHRCIDHLKAEVWNYLRNDRRVFYDKHRLLARWYSSFRSL